MRDLNSNSLYPGEPLKPGQIRLLELLPGEWSSNIQCNLLRASVSSKTSPYQSLSYTWGSTWQQRHIYVDGKERLITKNLETALRRLRHLEKPLILWVDALCINQDDNEERSRQVQMMGDIYRSATNVFIHLGDGIDHTNQRRNARHLSKITPSAPIHFHGTDLDDEFVGPFLEKSWGPTPPATTLQRNLDVFCLLSALARNSHLHEIPLLDWPLPDRSLGDQRFSEGFQNDFQRLNVFEAMRRMMHAPWAPWWHRIWVVQEVVVPPRITVVYGHLTAPWEMFASAAENYNLHCSTCCLKSAESIPRDYSKVIQNFSRHVQDISELRAAYSLSESDISQRHQRTLVSLLRRFRSRKATDPRDKVFALLALAKDTSLRPNYFFNTADVFIEAALESIRSTKSFSVLALSEMGLKFRQDLPSWVPDWSASGDPSELSRVEAAQLYACNANQPLIYAPLARLHPRGKLLGVEAMRFGTVEQVGDVMRAEGISMFSDTLWNWTEVALRFRELNISEPETPQREIPPPPPLWTVFCADMLYADPKTSASSSNKFRRTTAEDGLTFQLWAWTSERSPFCKGFNHEKRKSWLSDVGESTLATQGMKAADELADRLATLGDVSGRSFLDRFESFVLSLDARMESKDSHLGRAIPFEGDKFTSAGFLIKSLCKAAYSSMHRWYIQEDLKGKEGLVARMDASIASATMNRRIFVARSSPFQCYIGLGPANMEVGDQLMLLRGGTTPSILRRSPTPEDNERILTLVGDCYAHGLMDGTNATGWKRICLE
ncbi:heterokaryon incompatibility protein-domain-containing protein [Podospora didyma]|uniref:Heterokaryon incompatibility protein-domain-containing protein n=1 Tax=Podospora didyma TaxID=330526 RepID=A0AAE0U3V9_9PEZI|nr:heterokaryon incompatibility protein-domain-containing protein [Podospora didyma]